MTESEKPTYGQRAVGSWCGQRVRVRYGTSPLGNGWEVIDGDLFGHIPLDQLKEVELEP